MPTRSPLRLLALAAPLLVALGGLVACVGARAGGREPAPGGPDGAAAAAGAGEEAGEDASEPSTWNAAPDAGAWSVRWRVAGGAAVPRNREFDLELRVARGGVPRSPERLEVTGWMPDHQHGFVNVPAVVAVGPGRYRVEGMLLHMRGRWQLRIAVDDGGEHETVVIELEL